MLLAVGRRRAVQPQHSVAGCFAGAAAFFEASAEDCSQSGVSHNEVATVQAWAVTMYALHTDHSDS